MKFGAVTMAYNDETIIGGTLRCLKPFVSKHIVMLSEKPFYGKPREPDNTEKISLDLGAIVVKGFWEEHIQRNIGTQLCSDCDWVICFDSDEMMTRKDLDKLIEILDTTHTQQSAVAIRSKVYWRTTDYRLDPYPQHQHILAIRPTVKYWDFKCVDCDYDLLGGITHHHLAWAEPKDILKKIVNYNHAVQFDGEKWYWEHFMKWKEGDKAIEPFGTIFDAVKDPLPQELLELL